MNASRTGNLLRVCLLALCASEIAAVHGQPEPRPVELSKPGLTTPPPATEAQADFSRYESMIADLELRYGAYHEELSEALVGLSRARSTRGDYAGAVTALQRSLHINRVTNGLQDLGQMPILELLIEANKGRRDWRAVDQNYLYMCWLARRAFGENDTRQLRVLYEAAQWHLDAYHGGLDEDPLFHLLQALDLFNKATAIIEDNGGVDSPELINPLYGSALTLFEMNKFTSDYFNGAQDGMDNDRRTGIDERMTEWENQYYAIIGNTFREGKAALERVITIYKNHPELPADERTVAYVHLGDWYLLYNKENRALSSYHEAYSVAGSEEGLPEKIDKLFSEPRSIPSLSISLRRQEVRSPIETDDNSNYVVASFDVSETGRPFNVRIIESRPATNATLRRQVRQDIRGSRFRPRFEKGRPVAGTKVNFRYVFPGTVR